MKLVLKNGRTRVNAIVCKSGNFYREFTFGDSLGNFLSIASDPSVFDVTLWIPNEIGKTGDLGVTRIKVDGQTALARYRHLMEPTP